MNIKRGLFRLWIIFLILFIVVTTLSSINEIKEEFKYATWIKAHQLMLPGDCTVARGKLNVDYIQDSKSNFCWYTLSKFRSLYPEYNDISYEQLIAVLYEKANHKIQSSPWIALLEVICFAVGAPILILIFGWSLIWAFSGFRETLE